MQDCVATVGARFHEPVSYQPASRYWPLQWYELAMFLAAAIVLAGLCVACPPHRLTHQGFIAAPGHPLRLYRRTKDMRASLE